MGANGRDESSDRKRLLLTIPIATVITTMWIAAGVRALLTGDVEAWAIASVPFGGVWGWVFGGSFIPRGAQRDG